MFSYPQIVKASRALSAFMSRIEEIPGIDLDKITFSVPLTVGGETVTIRETPKTVAIEHPESDHVFMTKPDASTLLSAVRSFKKMLAMDECTSIAETLVTSMADRGCAYVENMPEETVKLFLSMWSDAYGEDHVPTFLKAVINENGEKLYTGFVKTTLTPAEIAAKNNEDGDNDPQPKPMCNKKEAN